jgi:hypothetical protein
LITFASPRCLRLVVVDGEALDRMVELALLDPPGTLGSSRCRRVICRLGTRSEDLSGISKITWIVAKAIAS